MWPTLAIDIQTLGTIVTESIGLFFFLLAIAFLHTSRRIDTKAKELESESATDEESERNCFSYKWAIDNSTKTRRVFAANLLYVAIPFMLAICTSLILLMMLQSFGYVMLLSFVVMAIFLDTEAFESLSYGKAVIKKPLSQLNKEDQSYMKIAEEALELAFVRFLIVGSILAIVGPFITQVFDGLIYTLGAYSLVLFSTTEVAFAVSPVLALLIALILPGVLLYLPELIGKILIHKMRVWGPLHRMLHGKSSYEELESGEKLPYAFMTASNTAITMDSNERASSRLIISSHNVITVLKEPSRKKNAPEE